MRERIPEIDTAKTLGIVLVVLAHVLSDSSHSVSKAVSSGIYLFHMPLFFVVSGFLYSPSSARSLAVKRWYTLVVPYVAGVSVILLTDTVLSVLMGTDPAVNSAKGLAGLILGGSYATGIYGVLWFASCLYITNVSYAAVVGARSPVSPAVIAWMSMVACVAVPLSFAGDIPNPLGIFAVPAALLCFWFGQVTRYSGVRSQTFLIATVCSAVIGVMALAILGQWAFDMKHLDFGPPIVGLAVALSASAAFILLCFLLGDGRFSRYAAQVGALTFPVMMLHQLVHLKLRSAGIENDFLIFVCATVAPLGFAWAVSKSRYGSFLFLGAQQGEREKFAIA